jgi:alpha-tubulin suppressor-like RCC1 family protein
MAYHEMPSLYLVLLVAQVVDLEEVPISDIAAGGWHSVALAADGSVIIWGRGEYGRLGIGDRTGSSKLRPFKVRGIVWMGSATAGVLHC